MKNRPVLLAILLLPPLLAACGNKEAGPPDSSSVPDREGLATGPAEAANPIPAPTDLLACPGFLSLAEVRGDAQIGAAKVLSSESPAVLVEYYAANLAADGWTLNVTREQQGVQQLQFSQNGRLLRLQIGPAAGSGGASIQIAWKQPAGATEFADAHSPDSEDEATEPENQGSIEW